jgi:L-ribulose-5-phosphate 3-epimerase
MTARGIGIMQGRLTPPVDGRIQAFPADRWREEFPRAQDAGLSCIEWIYETYGRDRNPLCTDGGVAALKDLSTRYHVVVRSVCADYFMEQTLVRADGDTLTERLDHLRWLVAQCRRAGIERIVLPFVDASDVRTADEENALTSVLALAERDASAAGVELHLEMSFAPARFAAFLSRVPASIRVNYDSGNSASLGYRPDEEFAAYGPRIGSVHVKDRVRGGSTVPLGQGNADLPAFFAGLKRIGYRGDIILQVARGESGHEVEWARKNRGFVEAAFAR